jgi:hypothetical protein
VSHCDDSSAALAQKVTQKCVTWRIDQWSTDPRLAPLFLKLNGSMGVDFVAENVRGELVPPSAFARAGGVAKFGVSARRLLRH